MGRRHTTFIVDKAGMVVASSRSDLILAHMGNALGGAPPHAEELRALYGQSALRTVDVHRPLRPLRDDDWLLDDRSFLLTRNQLNLPNYTLMVFTPIDRVNAVRPLHYATGIMAALFAGALVLLVNRRAKDRARQRHNNQVTRTLNEKLIVMNRDKDRYLGIAAHDLRNPLSSIRGLAELLNEPSIEPQQRAEFAETIRRTSDEMLGLVNDLLDTSVIESGKLDVHRTEQDVTKLVDRRIRHLLPQAGNKHITIDVGRCEGRAFLDPARFGQVVDNLVSNAIKFSPPNTTVRVTAVCQDNDFTFSVQDQGPGIPPGDRTLLFRSFQKLSARPTAGEKSTGLGLAIVKKIVDAHLGTIVVDDAPGGGTRFTVSIPRVAEA